MLWFCNLYSLLLLSLQVVKSEKGLTIWISLKNFVPESDTKEVGVLISIYTVCMYVWLHNTLTRDYSLEIFLTRCVSLYVRKQTETWFPAFLVILLGFLAPGTNGNTSCSHAPYCSRQLFNITPLKALKGFFPQSVSYCEQWSVTWTQLKWNKIVICCYFTVHDRFQCLFFVCARNRLRSRLILKDQTILLRKSVRIRVCECEK